MDGNIKCNLTDRLNINTHTKDACSSTISNNEILFKICHQNIRGLKSKTKELICSFGSNYPHVLCLTEHHMSKHELDSISIEHYNLLASFCRKHKKMVV
jgi:hypothetical protein